jgi:hypothetical protein
MPDWLLEAPPVYDQSCTCQAFTVAGRTMGRRGYGLSSDVMVKRRIV